MAAMLALHHLTPRSVPCLLLRASSCLDQLAARQKIPGAIFIGVAHAEHSGAGSVPCSVRCLTRRLGHRLTSGYATQQIRQRSGTHAARRSPAFEAT